VLLLLRQLDIPSSVVTPTTIDENILIATPSVNNSINVAPLIIQTKLGLPSILSNISVAPINSNITIISPTVKNEISLNAAPITLSSSIVTPIIKVGEIALNISPIFINIKPISPSIAISSTNISTTPKNLNIIFGNHVIQNNISVSANAITLQSTISSNITIKQSAYAPAINFNTNFSTTTFGACSYFISTKPSNIKINIIEPTIKLGSISTNAIAINENISIISPAICIGTIYANPTPIKIKQDIITPNVSIGKITSNAVAASITINPIFAKHIIDINTTPINYSTEFSTPIISMSIKTVDIPKMNFTILNQSVYCCNNINAQPLILINNIINPSIAISTYSIPGNFVSCFVDNIIEQCPVVNTNIITIKVIEPFVDYYKMNFADIDVSSIQPIIKHNDKYAKVIISSNVNTKGILTGC